MTAPAMVTRVAAAQATLDHFKDVPFAFGKYDCVRMVAFHLRRLKITPQLARGGPYTSALGARRALARAGYASLHAALDGHGFLRIPPAAALVGDIVSLPGTDALAALGVVLGNGRVLMFHEDAVGAVVVQPVEFGDAWRVPV